MKNFIILLVLSVTSLTAAYANEATPNHEAQPATTECHGDCQKPAEHPAN